MSTTVSYKGSTIATVANETKTLTTSGKWLEDDITLVDVTSSAPSTQTKSATPSESQQTIEPDSGYLLSSVTVGAISSTYVGSSIMRNDSNDLTVSGDTVTAPTGYYASAASKSVASGALSNPSISVSDGGLITATSGVGTAGYLTTSATASNTSQLTALAATTYNTSSSDQTITSGKYITGTQTIKAVTTSNISAANIKYNTVIKVGDSNDDDRIAGVTGTFSGSSTVSSGQTAAGAAQILRGYSGFVDGAEVMGSIETKTSSDLTASGDTVTVPAGYYASQATKSVSAMTLPTSAAASATSGYSSKATISRSTSDQYINIPTGYNSSGAYYKVNAVPNGTVTAPSSISGSSATVTTGTNTVTFTKTVSVTPSVTTAGYISSGTAGDSSVSLTASINTRSGSDLTASGDTVTVPAGYYGSQATKSVASGTEGTPTATKGTVSNHSVSVTPSVTNTAGYISGSTKTGTAVTVTASELASGNKEITANGTNIDVVGYSTASVAVPNSVVVTDTSNTNGTTAAITADSVGTLVTKTITTNGTYTASSDNADGYSSVTVSVSGGGSVTQDANGYIVIPSS